MTFKKGQSSVFKGKKRPNISGENHWNYKNGTIKHEIGYILVLKPNHPFCDKHRYVRRSHLVMEQMIGRYLNPSELVHHKGIHFPLGSVKNRQDDSPENLQLFANKNLHTKYHHKLKGHKLKITCKCP